MPPLLTPLQRAPVGSEADSDDSGVWRDVGGRKGTDCSEYTNNCFYMVQYFHTNSIL